MTRAEKLLAEEFVCKRCGERGAHVERLAMSGTGISRMIKIQPYRYAFVSCRNCGYTEVYNLKTLEERDNPGTSPETLFHD
jgi:predicted nucleic-acid-binding Zn-ribbon protein